MFVAIRGIPPSSNAQAPSAEPWNTTEKKGKPPTLARDETSSSVENSVPVALSPERCVSATKGIFVTGVLDPKVLEHDLDAEWNALIGQFAQAETRLNQLSQGPACPFQQQIAGLKLNKLINRAEQAVFTVKSENTQPNRQALENLAIEITQAQAALPISPMPDVENWNKLLWILSGLTCAIWAVLLKASILAATSAVVTWAPPTAGLLVIAMKCGEFIWVRIVEKEREEQSPLVDIHDVLISTLRKVKDKMISEAHLRKMDDIREAHISELAEVKQELAEQNQLVLQKMQQMQTLMASLVVNAGSTAAQPSPQVGTLVTDLTADLKAMTTEGSQQKGGGNEALTLKLQELKTLAETEGSPAILKAVNEAIALLEAATHPKATAELV